MVIIAPLSDKLPTRAFIKRAGRSIRFGNLKKGAFGPALGGLKLEGTQKLPAQAVLTPERISNKG